MVRIYFRVLAALACRLLGDASGADMDFEGSVREYQELQRNCKVYNG